jgi:hypothetical protein
MYAASGAYRSPWPPPRSVQAIFNWLSAAAGFLSFHFEHDRKVGTDFLSGQTHPEIMLKQRDEIMIRSSAIGA